LRLFARGLKKPSSATGFEYFDVECVANGHAVVKLVNPWITV